MFKHRRRAFTLVELLVVIGIIAIMVGILLPTLSKARKQANLVVCAAQLRTIMQGLLIYANENSGTMPPGFAWRRAATNLVGNPSGNPRTDDGYYNAYGATSIPWAQNYHWPKVVSDVMVKSSDAGVFPNSATLKVTPLAKIFRCPDVTGNDYYNDSPNSYAANPVILVNQPFEVAPNGSMGSYWGGIFVASYTWTPNPVASSNGKGGTNFAVGPAKLSQLYGDNAVLWDSNVVNGGVFSGGGFSAPNVCGGFGMSGIDGGRLAEPQKGWQRYRNGATKKLIDPADLPDRPILFPTKKMEKLYSYNFPWVNNDPFNGFMAMPDQSGNARFRHLSNDTCNVAFADGSVKSLKISINKVAYLDKLGDEVADSDFKRSYLQIRKPGGLPGPQQIGPN